MHLSTILFTALASGITTLGAPVETAIVAAVPAGYKWTLSGWNSNAYGIGWANFDNIEGPAATGGGVTVPALSLTGRCSITTGGPYDCNALIANNGDNSRKIEFKLRPFDNSLKKMQWDTTYTFNSGSSTYKLTGLVESDLGNTPITFTATPSALTQA